MDELEKDMYYGATPVTLIKAKQLRHKMTPTEKILWEKLKRKQICNARFRRQHPIETFIVDFYCHSAKLVIEIDGGIHNKTKIYDAMRTKEIEKYDIFVKRYTNEEIIANLNNVVSDITILTTLRINTL